MQWFDVDKDGLAKLLERKGKAWAIFELIQNAWDTEASRVDVHFEPIASVPYVAVTVVDDDPNGFSKLDHAFTLFAESDKKSDPSKRGRFNLGEKLVLALCRKATIRSTTGSVVFDETGRRKGGYGATKVGSIFTGEMRMTRDELAEIRLALCSLIVPAAPITAVDGELLPRHRVVRGVQCNLPTEIADAEGYLRRTRRDTTLETYQVEKGETAHLYEMGIPVVELPGDKWHVNICQKIPLNIDRDNVTPAYLRQVRVDVLNMSADLITRDDAKEPWVRDAAGDEMASTAAITRVIDLRFGPNRVIADPSDPEGTKLALSRGYVIITGGSLSAGEWENVHRAGAALPAGQVTPSPKPYDPKGAPLNVVPEEDWGTSVTRFVHRACLMAEDVLGLDRLEVTVVDNVWWPYNATYAPGKLTINRAALGLKWFELGNLESQLALLIHEFGHHYSTDHLSADYHKALCRISAKALLLACGELMLAWVC